MDQLKPGDAPKAGARCPYVYTDGSEDATTCTILKVGSSHKSGDDAMYNVTVTIEGEKGEQQHIYRMEEGRVTSDGPAPPWPNRGEGGGDPT